MSNTNMTIISGEAAETDSEEESAAHTISLSSPEHKLGTNVQGEIVNGEDSESDCEGNKKCPRSPSKNNTTASTPVKHKYTSLLHKKLNENNQVVHKNLNSFFINKINEASASLNNTDRQLLKSQLTLQLALNSLRSLNLNSMSIKNVLKNIVIDDSYLHNLVIINDVTCKNHS